MAPTDEFDVNRALKEYLSDPLSISTPEADSAALACEDDPEELTEEIVAPALDPIVDAIAANPEALLDQANFDTIQLLLKFSASISSHSLNRLVDLIVSGLSVAADIIGNDLDLEDEPQTVKTRRVLLEMYAFLMQWSIAAIEARSTEKPTNTASRSRAPKSSKAKGAAKSADWDSGAQLKMASETMCKVMRLKLIKVFVTTSERDTFISLFTRPVYMILENEQRIKDSALRMHAFKVLCVAIKHHGHAFGAQTSIVQNLSYFEHLSEPMAEFLHILAEQYDYPQLTDEVLRDLSNKEFNNNDTRGPKSISTFFIRLSELAPRLVIKQMTLLIKQLDSEAYTLRCAIIDVCGNLIVDLSKNEDRNEVTKTQINAFFDLLEERFLDVNPYCRCRAIQVFIKLCDLEQKFPKRRQTACELAARHLEDKSSNVRRNAVKLLTKSVSTHPFSVMHGGQLSSHDWNTRLQAVDQQLNELLPGTNPIGVDGSKSDEADEVDGSLLDEPTNIESPQKASNPTTEEEQKQAMEKAMKDAATSEALTRLQLTRKYYTEAIRFIDTIHDAAPNVCQLLSAKNKSEVIEAMDFFVVIDAYNMEAAKDGIRRMLRLVWTKGNSDEGKGVQSHLIECYRGLFFSAPDTFSENDVANYISRNMISLTFGASAAELTSLEQLLQIMVQSGHVSALVISKIWQIYGVQNQEISAKQRRGAIIVLGMLATADNAIIIAEINSILRIGLGVVGRKDLILAKYSCLALQRIQPSKQQAVKKTMPITKFNDDHAIIQKLVSVVEMISDDKEWYGVAEQAIGAIYILAQHPDEVCSAILRRKILYVFQPEGTDNDISADVDAIRTSSEEAPEKAKQFPGKALSQLLFIVGHIAIKQIVYLEQCESEVKKRKAEKERSGTVAASPSKKIGASEEYRELDLIGGTTEDDITDAMTHIREHELLFDEHALLSNFGPMVADICANNTIYDDEDVQAAATLCLAKLMCVSSEYCEKNLPLLLTILERSDNAVTRSNLVIALGDMAVSFNHLIDENTDFLYRRLNDPDASVKRTCLMTLTFLILAGQVKVKGQLGEMAKCIEDSDKRIADLSRMFFSELATKDNAIYNHFIDMFSLLSAEKELEEESLRRIIRFLASFIEKDKHAKQLADKLAARLPRCDSERQWNDVAFALSLLQHKNEDITKTVNEGFKLVSAAG